MSWLDSVVEQMKAKNEKAEQKKVKTASKKMSKEEINQRVKKASKIAIKKSLLKKASVGDKVKYNGFMWEIIDTNFKDAAGEGIVLKKIAEISSKKVTDPAEYARTDPGDVYDYEVRDSYEVPELNETAANTESRISQENAVDRTTPAGRATNPYTAFTQEIMTEVNEIDAPVEEAPVNETPVEETPVEEAPTEEVPVEETVVEDEGVPAEHDLEEEKEEKEASTEDENEDLQCGTLKDEIVEASHKSLKMHKKAKRENPILASIKGKKEVKRENPILASIKSKK
jgi:hypothetical protein